MTTTDVKKELEMLYNSTTCASILKLETAQNIDEISREMYQEIIKNHAKRVARLGKESIIISQSKFNGYTELLEDKYVKINNVLIDYIWIIYNSRAFIEKIKEYAESDGYKCHLSDGKWGYKELTIYWSDKKPIKQKEEEIKFTYINFLKLKEKISLTRWSMGFLSLSYVTSHFINFNINMSCFAFFANLICVFSGMLALTLFGASFDL